MAEVMASLEVVVSLVGSVFTMITSNGFLTAFFAMSLIGGAIGVFSSLKSAAGG